jgi:hypothetical protein
MPPLGTVSAALRKLTEHLASEISRPAAAAPDWSELEWKLAPAVAATHGISPLLASVLRWHGPEGWRAFLTEQQEHAADRHDRALQLLAVIGEQASRAGVPVIPLKGAALRTLGLYAGGARPMADLDLLVRPRDENAAVRVLSSLGYRESAASWKHRAFEPECAEPRGRIGEHRHNPLKIDLHVRVAERLPHPETDISHVIFASELQAGLNEYRSKASLMLHILAHAAGAMVQRELRLIQLCDIARLGSRLERADWDELMEHGGRKGTAWWATPPLLLAARYFPGYGPADLIGRFALNCPWLLQRVSRRRLLADVSYTRLFYDPFPGILWTRSPVGALRYLLGRASRAREQFSRSTALERTEPWGANRSTRDASQAARVLRWFTSRPIRMEAIRPVRAALGIE